MIEPLEPPLCPVCQHPLLGRRSCWNKVCHWPDRGFKRIWALGRDSGTYGDAIRRYKFAAVPDSTLAEVLGLYLARRLLTDPSFMLFDLITPTPTFVDPASGRGWDHIETLVSYTYPHIPSWWGIETVSSDRPIIQQTLPTPRFSSQDSWEAREHLANGSFRTALRVPDPARIRGRTVLVVDDIFTEGLRTRTVAKTLLAAGAAEVCGLVLARHVADHHRSYG